MRKGKETEIKLAVSDATAARARLRRLGFVIRQPRRFEQNTLFDTTAGALRRRGVMLRLRSVNRRHWLTFKGPAEGSQRYKVRPEFEIELADAVAGKRILAGLGFEPVFRYEKYRTVWGPPGVGGEAMLDETPIGNFLELEGSRAWIRSVARALGAGPEHFITRTYTELFTNWRRRTRRRDPHMAFPGHRRAVPS